MGFIKINIGTIAPTVGVIYFAFHKFIFKGLINKWYWHPVTFTASSYISLAFLFFYLVANGMFLNNISIQKTPLNYIFGSGCIGVFVVLLTFKFISLLNHGKSDKTSKQDMN